MLQIGAETLAIDEDGATQEESIFIGESTRAFAGNLRSVVRAEKRQWSFQTVYITQAQETAVRAIVANKAQVTCVVGLAGSTVTATCEVTITGSRYVRNGAVADRVLSLRLVEV